MFKGFFSITSLIIIIIFGLFFYRAQTAYADAQRRAIVTSAIQKITGLKFIIEEMSIQDIDDFPEGEILHETLKVDGGDKGISMEYVLIITVENEIINIVFGEGAFGGKPVNMTFIPKKEGYRIVWVCNGGNLPIKYRPESCK